MLPSPSSRVVTHQSRGSGARAVAIRLRSQLHGIFGPRLLLRARMTSTLRDTVLQSALGASCSSKVGKWRRGEDVELFYRAHAVGGGRVARFEVAKPSFAARHVAFGLSAGWVRATVLEDTCELDVLRRKAETWVPVRVHHP